MSNRTWPTRLAYETILDVAKSDPAYEAFRTQVAENIRTLRLGKGLSQEEVSGLDMHSVLPENRER